MRPVKLSKAYEIIYFGSFSTKTHALGTATECMNEFVAVHLFLKLFTEGAVVTSGRKGLLSDPTRTHMKYVLACLWILSDAICHCLPLKI